MRILCSHQDTIEPGLLGGRCLVDDRELIGAGCFVVLDVLIKGVVRAVNGHGSRLDGRSIVEREVGSGTRRAMFG